MCLSYLGTQIPIATQLLLLLFHGSHSTALWTFFLFCFFGVATPILPPCLDWSQPCKARLTHASAKSTPACCCVFPQHPSWDQSTWQHWGRERQRLPTLQRAVASLLQTPAALHVGHPVPSGPSSESDGCFCTACVVCGVSHCTHQVCLWSFNRGLKPTLFIYMQTKKKQSLLSQNDCYEWIMFLCLYFMYGLFDYSFLTFFSVSPIFLIYHRFLFFSSLLLSLWSIDLSCFIPSFFVYLFTTSLHCCYLLLLSLNAVDCLFTSWLTFLLLFSVLYCCADNNSFWFNMRSKILRFDYDLTTFEHCWIRL